MTSRERMLYNIAGKQADHIPCSFMLFFNLYEQCGNDTEYVERSVDMGLDACSHVGYLQHSLHPEATYSEWVEQDNSHTYFCRKIDTPKGPLTARVRQWKEWPREGTFPLMDDWLVPRAEEVLVKPEKDLEKLPYLFGDFTNESIAELKGTAKEARRVAEKHDLLLTGGWKGTISPGKHSDMGVMGCDAMAWLSGYEEIVVLSVLNPEIIKEYAEIIHQWNLKQIQMYLEVAEPDLVIRRGWYETIEFWTPEAYRTIIAPTIKREADLVHQAGKKYGYIITSAFLPLLDDILGAGVDVIIGLDPGQGKGTEITAVKKKTRAAGRCIWGGVSGALTVELGSEAETRKSVKAAIDSLGGGGGFILSPVDNVREDTDNAWKNTYAFIDEWKKRR